MPNAVNRVKSWAWAFNEVSWLDILNGYAFKYAKIGVTPAVHARGQQALQQIAAAQRQGVDPRSFTPVATGSNDARFEVTPRAHGA
jgi:hypothetical protein